jgi:hypothetical protein
MRDTQFCDNITEIASVVLDKLACPEHDEGNSNGLLLFERTQRVEKGLVIWNLGFEFV